MPEKIKACFTPHVMMHALFGLGLGILLVNLIPSLNSAWLGVGLMVLSVVFDAMRKN